MVNTKQIIYNCFKKDKFFKNKMKEEKRSLLFIDIKNALECKRIKNKIPDNKPVLICFKLTFDEWKEFFQIKWKDRINVYKYYMEDDLLFMEMSLKLIGNYIRTEKEII